MRQRVIALRLLHLGQALNQVADADMITADTILPFATRCHIMPHMGHKKCKEYLAVEY